MALGLISCNKESPDPVMSETEMASTGLTISQAEELANLFAPLLDSNVISQEVFCWEHMQPMAMEDIYGFVMDITNRLILSQRSSWVSQLNSGMNMMIVCI